MNYKDLVIKYFKEVLEEGNFDVLDEIIHPEYFSKSYYGNQEMYGPGIEKLKARIKLWKESFSEKYRLLQIMENDEAAFCQYEVTTKQLKTWFDKKPKDKTSRVEGFILFTIKHNKILHTKDNFDYTDLWSQLGYLVDIGEFQLPGHLITSNNVEKIQLDQNKVAKIEEDFSMLQSSAIQYQDLLQYASYVQNFMNISDKAIRSGLSRLLVNTYSFQYSAS